ncbi:MAG: PAS domain S-box protein, partial [Candidatus Omnitrophota bacterium]
ISVIDLTTGKLMDTNEAALRIFNFTREDVIGTYSYELIAEKDRARSMEDIKHTLETGDSSLSEWILLGKGGTEHYCEARSSVIRDSLGNPQYLINVIRDISERKRIEKELSDYKENLEKMVAERTAELSSTYEELIESEERLRGFFENVPDILFAHNMKGQFTEINKKALEISGYSRDEIVGRNVLETGILPADQIEGVAAGIKGIEEGESGYPYEVQLIKKNGDRITVEAVSFPIKRKGVLEVMGIARDITERKKAVVKLKESKEELRFYLNQITKTQEEERKRIARELHDDTIQELITLSRQLDDLIDKKLKPDEDRRGSRKKIEEAHQKVTSILKGVRRFTRDLRPSILDDLGLVPALEWLTSDMSAQFRIPIDISIIGTKKKIAPDAALAMFRVAQESLRNAGHHSKASQIQLNLKFISETVTLSIIDNGKGFTPPKQISSLTRHGKLGVAGMYERAQLIGATLSIKSKRNKGTIITLEVPIK